jgi:hypothetical protein
VTWWCAKCFQVTHEGKAGVNDPINGITRATAYVDAMAFWDWTAMFFSIVIVAFAVCKELQDIELCTLAMNTTGGEVARLARYGLKMLTFLRRWVFLSVLTNCIPVLVWTQGADALSVCFNTVAILFL